MPSSGIFVSIASGSHKTPEGRYYHSRLIDYETSTETRTQIQLKLSSPSSYCLTQKGEMGVGNVSRGQKLSSHRRTGSPRAEQI